MTDHRRLNEYTQVGLSILITLGFFGVLGMLMCSTIPTTNERVVDVMIGALGTAWLVAIGYHFGSSSGSEAKTRMMNKLITPSDENGVPHA